MKKIFSTPTICFLLIAGFLFQSCAKKVESQLNLQNDFSNKSVVQVYMAMVNASRNYVYVNGNAVNGSSLISGSVFPASGLGFSAPVGLTGFLVRDTLSTTTQIPLSFASNLAANRNYTVFVYDTINSPQQKTVETVIEVPKDSTARLRFANFIFTKVAVPAVDIFSKRRNINLFTNVQTTDVTGFIPVPSAFNDTLFVRETGTANLLATLNGLNPVAKRSYTIVFRGRYQSTTGTVARTLSSFINY